MLKNVLREQRQEQGLMVRKVFHLGVRLDKEGVARRRILCIMGRVLFIGTQCSNLYTSVDTPAKGRVGGDVFVISCKYVLGQPQVS